MKKILVFALCVTGFMFIAAPTAVEYHQVLLNGKPFANAALINGVIAIKVSDLATATGDTLTLEHYKLNGGTLTTVGDVNTTFQHKDASPAKKVREAALVPAVQKAQPQTQAKIKGESRAAIIAIRKAGNISTNVFMFEGKGWVPLKDVANAFGGVFNQGNLKPTESIQLNFTSNANALIGLL